jgi:hypothetical protein
MIKLKAIKNKLKIFDFDGTLMNTDSKAYVTHTNGVTDSYNADEWNKYIKQSGDKFNFDEFFTIDYLINPREIKERIDLLKQFIKHGDDVWILTNRTNVNPIIKYFKQKGLNIKAYGTGTAEPIAKKVWIEQKIKEGYSDISFYDDSKHNIKIVSTLKSKYSNIKLNTILVSKSDI